DARRAVDGRLLAATTGRNGRVVDALADVDTRLVDGLLVRSSARGDGGVPREPRAASRAQAVGVRRFPAGTRALEEAAARRRAALGEPMQLVRRRLRDRGGRRPARRRRDELPAGDGGTGPRQLEGAGQGTCRSRATTF